MADSKAVRQHYALATGALKDQGGGKAVFSDKAGGSQPSKMVSNPKMKSNEKKVAAK